MMILYTILATVAAAGAILAGFVRKLFGDGHLLMRVIPPRDVPESAGKRIWIHAASMGESAIAGSLAGEITSRNPDVLVFVSVVTKTGFERIRRSADGGGPVTRAFLAPIDQPWIVAAFFDRIRPTSLILVETELWPWLMTVAERRGVPVSVVNGKISRRGFRRYMYLRRMFRRLLGRVTHVCVQTRPYSRRFRMLGVPEDRIEIIGNVKFDVLPSREDFDRDGIRRSLGVDGQARLFVAGSTRPGEEAIIAASYAELWRRGCRMRMVIAPRHLSRVVEITAILDGMGLTYVRRSEGDELDLSDDGILILDTMGELIAVFAAADAAFVGGSFSDFGGHNPLEPAALGVPVLFGPYMEQTGSGELLSSGAAVLVHDESELADALYDIFTNNERAQHMLETGPQVVSRFRGTLARTVDSLEKRKAL